MSLVRSLAGFAAISTLLICTGSSPRADEPKGPVHPCADIDTSGALATRMTEKRALLVYVSWPSDAPLDAMHRFAAPEELRDAGITTEPGFRVAVTEYCGGTSDCSSKVCQGPKASCVQGTNGCFCQDSD
jgi:hypothetical protein